MNLAEIGKKVKEKYPEYNDIPDSELGARTVNKYPQYQDMVTNEPTPNGKSITTEKPPANASTIKDTMAMVGGTAGSIAGGPVGAGIGGALGNMIGQVGEQGGMIPPSVGIPVAGVPPKGDIDFSQVLKEGAVQGVMDKLGGVAAKPIQKLLGWGTGIVKPHAKEARKFLQQFGGELTPGQMTKGFGLDTMENVARAGLLSGGKMVKFSQEMQTKPINSAIKSIVGDLGTPMQMDDLGLMVSESLKGNKQLKNMVMGKAYKQLDEAIGNPMVDMREVKGVLQDVIDKAPIEGSESARKAAKLLKGLDDFVTFERAHIEQSNLFDLPSGSKQLMSNKDKANSNIVRSSILKAMGNSAKSVSDEAFTMWKNIRKTYGETMKPFNSKFVNQLVNSEGGEQTMTKIFNQKSPALINKLRAALGNDKKWDTVKASWLAKRTDDYINEEGLFNSKQFIKDIQKMGDSYDAIFKGAQKESIDKLVNTLNTIEEKGVAGKTGSMFIQLKQAAALGAIGGLAGYREGGVSGAAVGGAGAILLTPVVFAKVLTSPSMTNYLTRTISNGSQQAISQFNKFAARLSGSLLTEENSKDVSPQ